MNGPPKGAGTPVGAVHGFLLLVNVLLAMVLVMGAILRETPLFWTNAGGYPLLLRDFVKYGFPLLWLIVGGLASLAVLRSWALLRSGRTHAGIAGLLVSLLHWGLWGTATGIAVWNNLNNLLRGLPVHSHW